MSDLTHAILGVVGVVAAFALLPLVIGMMEHKAMAHMQARMGPMYAGGFHGWAQLIADGVKFIQKEDVVPAAADRTVFQLAPIAAVVPYIAVLVLIPIGPGRQVAQPLDQGLFVALALLGIGVIGMLMAGWASANKFALLGALRGAAQLMSYELPMVLAAASVAMQAGTLSLTGIAEQWKPWWLASQLIAFGVFMTAGLAELRRPPFDMPIAESELVFGFLTEYTGMRFAFFLLAEYAGILVLCALASVLFLGGWRLPYLPDQLAVVGTLAKTLALSFAVIWVRVSVPRLREDQLQRLSWLGLVPLALLQVVITAVIQVNR